MIRLVPAAALAVVVGLTACSRDAQVVSQNLSQAADAFQIDRRVVFYNGITGEYMLVIEGRCSIEPVTGRLEVVCKVGDGVYKKHFLGISDNVTYFAEHLDPTPSSTIHYKVIFKPASIIPDIDLVTKENSK